ncbi:MAG: hypothetical protein ACE5F9_14870 [Phycisphaerae bacterium]
MLMRIGSDTVWPRLVPRGGRAENAIALAIVSAICESALLEPGTCRKCGVSQGWTRHGPADVDRCGGTVRIEVENGLSSDAELGERKGFVDPRPGVGLRVSPHFSDSDDELNEALRIISSVMDQSSRDMWSGSSDHPSSVRDRTAPTRPRGDDIDHRSVLWRS